MQGVLDMIPKTKFVKEKTDKLNFTKIKNLFCERYCQIIKRQAIDQEEMFVNHNMQPKACI